MLFNLEALYWSLILKSTCACMRKHETINLAFLHIVEIFLIRLCLRPSEDVIKVITDLLIKPPVELYQ